ncbi:hypothetical protein ACF053_27680 [Streptomyces kanasensis]|uniref:hypothetical protein n=1 Tax=Streptomyces kanasensis TaxID=936756 RepID=UPI0036F52341
MENVQDAAVGADEDRSGGDVAGQGRAAGEVVAVVEEAEDDADLALVLGVLVEVGGPSCERETDRDEGRSQPFRPASESTGEAGHLLGKRLTRAGALGADEQAHPQRHDDEFASRG